MYRIVDRVTGKYRGYIPEYDIWSMEFQRFKERNPTVQLFEMDENWKIKKKKKEKDGTPTAK
jgi:hypothetical protein